MKTILKNAAKIIILLVFLIPIVASFFNVSVWQIAGSGFGKLVDLITSPGKEIKYAKPFYELWEDEAKSTTLNPQNLASTQNVNGETVYRNTFFGYQFPISSDWQVDNHQIPQYSRFYGTDFRLDVTVQDVSEAWTNVEAYIKTTMEPLEKRITNRTTWNANGLVVQEYDFERPEITNIPNDLNAYSTYFVIRENVVYTFILKSNKTELANLKTTTKELINKMTFFERTPVDIFEEAKKVVLNPALKYEDKEGTLNIPSSHFMMSVFEPVSENIQDLEKQLGSSIGSQMFYKPIDSEYDSYVDFLAENKKTPVITFSFRNREDNYDNSNINIEIIEGKYDKQIRDWARGIKKSGIPVFVRLGNEMNGAWTEWSSKNSYNDPDIYKLAYRRIVDIYRSEKVDNALFVWNPNYNSNPFFAWNHSSMFYPGDNYVDWIGMTHYNFGDNEWGKFKSFSELYDNLYLSYVRSYPTKPFMIGEFASVETGGNKAQFISDVFTTTLEKYTNIKLVVWFNHIDGKYDFRINSSENSSKAFAEGMKSNSVVKKLE